VKILHLRLPESCSPVTDVPNRWSHLQFLGRFMSNHATDLLSIFCRCEREKAGCL